MSTDSAVDQAARAILDGTPPDWPVLESSHDLEAQEIAEQLKVLSRIAAIHRASEPEQAATGAACRADATGRWGPLDLLEKVGTGAFGEVYRAWDTRLDREVALKLLPAGMAPESSASPVIHEGRLLARVRHPN